MDNQTPLAERMRPQNLAEYIGQSHLLGEGEVLLSAIKTGSIPSMILWGPPGVGKTTLAQLLANELERPLFKLSAINSGVKDIREVFEKVERQDLFTAGKPILFIDEIHRFSKAQQDSLLGAVEKGSVTLIGATTENPSFEVISALLSRCQVYTLKSHGVDELNQILTRALENDTFLKSQNVELKETEALIQLSGGDARRILNLLELVCSQSTEKLIDNELVQKVIKGNPLRYDKNGEEHYDVISAFIKSIRGSDPNGAVYWLARMIEGGEEAKFIARRLIILASEDIGNANPNALILAQSTFDAVNSVGWPESRIILSQCAIYLASSPKSNASYRAINMAQQKVKETGNLSVPLPIRNAPTELMKELGYGNEYKYAHDFDGNFVEMEFLPDEIKGYRFYSPGNNKRELELRKYLATCWQDKYGY